MNVGLLLELIEANSFQEQQLLEIQGLKRK